MNWYIGQLVVCIDPSGELVKDDIYTIKGLRDSCCKCEGCEIDVGIRGDYSGNYCVSCGFDHIEDTCIAWYGDSQFIPIEYNQDAIEALLKETKVAAI